MSTFPKSIKLNKHKKLLVQAYFKYEDVNPQRKLKCVQKETITFFMYNS